MTTENKTSQNPIAPELENYANSPEFRQLTGSVLVAQAFTQVEKERVAAYITPLFQSFGFVVSPKFAERRGWEPNTPITDPEKIYMSDDKEKWDLYFEACDRAHRDHGFTGPHLHCPALVAESLQYDAERALLESVCPVLDIKYEDLTCNLDLLRNMLKALLGLGMSKYWPNGKVIMDWITE